MISINPIRKIGKKLLSQEKKILRENIILFYFSLFYRSNLSLNEDMAEEEIVKINRKLQKMIEKSEVVGFNSLNKYSS
jgi:hypothetical protein